MNKVGDEKNYPPLAKNRFLGIKGGGLPPPNQPKIQPCPIELKFSMIKVGDEIPPPLSQNPIVRQKWGTLPPNQPKIQPIPFEHTFSG